jgi:hypothetical protein
MAMAGRRRASFYVYYRVAGRHARRTGANRRADDEVAARTGIRGQLSARSDDPTTWMEDYASGGATGVVPADALRPSRERTARLALTNDGVRHVEKFVPLPPLSRRRKA